MAAADPERSHLREISAMLREGLAAAGINCGSSRGAGEEGATHIVPVILGANEAALHVAGVLQRRGFAAKAIRPPTVPPGTARLRISLTSKITVQDIRRLIAAMAAACENLPRGSAAHMHA